MWHFPKYDLLYGSIHYGNSSVVAEKMAAASKEDAADRSITRICSDGATQRSSHAVEQDGLRNL
jgi:hypothetical protein